MDIFSKPTKTIQHLVNLIVLLFFWSICYGNIDSKNAIIATETDLKARLRYTALVKKNVVSIDSIIYYSEKFNQLVNLIRDEKKDKQNAKMNVGFLLAQIQRLYKKQSVFVGKKPYIFPVRGYSSDAIGGKNGDGFKPGNYTFYDGNRHTGHPAHDIFIRDKDQNCLDDRSGKPVNIISLSNGIVIAAEPTWQVFSKLRGGIYLIVYNPIEDLLYYYAHNNKLFVKPGTIVRAGDKLAELGRSGMNAFKVRSPTHLHLMALKVKPNGNLVPVDLYPVLKMIIK